MTDLFLGKCSPTIKFEKVFCLSTPKHLKHVETHIAPLHSFCVIVNFLFSKDLFLVTNYFIDSQNS